MTATELTVALKTEARRLGFQAAGACPAVAASGVARFQEWLAAGYAGQMHYLADRAEAYTHPRHVLEGVRSILMLAINYRSDEPRELAVGEGRVSRYAWGDHDYHDLIHERLRSLKEFHLTATPQASVRGVVDTAPLLEREFAELAGLGWIGKNTLLLNKQLGSWFFLAALLTDAELEYDQPLGVDHCGTCRACLDVCPTSAFPRPYVLDATRCISYLTIELREEVPVELRPGIGDWLFGCDLCQDVCPWNRRAPISDEPAWRPREDQNPIVLAELFELDEAAFRQRFRGTPLWRSRRRGVLRNAALVLGNQKSPDSLPALRKGLSDADPLVRSTCAWALGQLRGPLAREVLRRRLLTEADEHVRSEIQAACSHSP